MAYTMFGGAVMFLMVVGAFLQVSRIKAGKRNGALSELISMIVYAVAFGSGLGMVIYAP